MKNILIIVGVLFLVGGAIYYFMNNEEDSVVENDVQNEEVKNEEGIEVELPTEVVEEETAQLPSSEFIQCLVDSGMEVYASKTCPACVSFADTLGGYDVLDDLFVFCNTDMEKCNENMQTNYVPEIQFNGEVYEDSRDLDSLASLTGCTL